MARGTFDDEKFNPTCFTVWALLPDHDGPVPFDSVEEAIEVIKLEALWHFGGEADAGHG